MENFRLMADYIGYFENLASLHASILHTEQKPAFGIIDYVQMKVSTEMAPTMVLLEYPEGRFAGANDSYYEDLLCAFQILDKPEDEAFSKKQIALDKCLDIGNDFIARMLKDYSESLIFDFDLTSVQRNKVGPVWDGHVGWRFQFGLSTKATLAVNTLNWTDL